jgi:hypothetical protein
MKHNNYYRTYLSDDIRQAGIAEKKPTSWRDSICFVLESVWEHFVEIFEAKQN